ncbi:reverse transcriptase domain-containing protein [Tanacetum coccineum]
MLRIFHRLLLLSMTGCLDCSLIRERPNYKDHETLRNFYENLGISHQTFVACTAQQNGIVKRRNRTLVEAARTMLTFSKAPLLSVCGNSQRTKNDRVKYEWDAKQGLVGNLKSSCTDIAKKTQENGQSRTRERKECTRAGDLLLKTSKEKERAPNIVNPKLRTIVAPMSGTNKGRATPSTHGRRIPFYGRESENPHAHINSFKRITSTLRFCGDDGGGGGGGGISSCSDTTYGNVNRDNIQEYVSQAAAANFNQGNTNPRPPNRVSNQMAPPGFAPVQNNGQNRFNQAQNQGNNFNRGNNFHQNQVNHVPNFQNQGFQNQPFQAHNNQFQQGIPSEITSYMKANESIVRNMQGQINEIRSTLTKQEENLRKNLNNDMRSILGSFFQNQASTSGTLPSNTIPNPKGEMKAITTRSGVAYEGPSIPTNPSPKKVVERETEETTDKEQTNFQGSTAQIPPSVIPISILEPDVPKTLPKTTPIPESDIPKNLPKPNIPYPSRRDDQKSRDKASNQMEKIFQIFQDLRFDISFADALLLMPRFAPTIKSLLMNKEKLLELVKIPFNENCSAMLLKKFPEKLGDPGKFLIPCNFLGMDVCHALADLGASINLMPLSIWKKLSLPELTPTRMTLELADRSITRPKGLGEDIFVKVGNFHFPTDFVIVDFEADP